MWDSIRMMLNNKGAKCLIVEDNKPRYVILTYEEYQHLQKDNKNSIVKENLESLLSVQDINGEMQDIQELQEDNRLRIEDLPF